MFGFGFYTFVMCFLLPSFNHKYSKDCSFSFPETLYLVWSREDKQNTLWTVKHTEMYNMPKSYLKFQAQIKGM